MEKSQSKLSRRTVVRALSAGAGAWVLGCGRKTGAPGQPDPRPDAHADEATATLTPASASAHAAHEAAAAGPPPPALPSGVAPSRGGVDLIGRPAPEWAEHGMSWIADGELRAQGPTLASLRGHVVLVRFWTDTCPFCRATAPALAAVDEQLRERGVRVVGLYHPKPRGKKRDPQEVLRVVREWGWQFDVGLDTDWRVLDAWWLASADRRYTSVSFVLDTEGIVQHVHPGPEWHADEGPDRPDPFGGHDHQQCRDDHDAIVRTLNALLV